MTTPPAVTVTVRATPRSGRDEILGADTEGVLRVRVAAAPVDGRANEAVVRLLAAALGVAPSALVVVRGSGARQKRIRINGVAADRVRERWPGIHMQSG